MVFFIATASVTSTGAGRSKAGVPGHTIRVTGWEFLIPIVRCLTVTVGLPVRAREPALDRDMPQRGNRHSIGQILAAALGTVEIQVQRPSGRGPLPNKAAHRPNGL